MSTETLKYELAIMRLADHDYKVVVTQGNRYVGDARTSTVRGCTTIGGLLIQKDAEARLVPSN